MHDINQCIYIEKRRQMVLPHITWNYRTIDISQQGRQWQFEAQLVNCEVLWNNNLTHVIKHGTATIWETDDFMGYRFAAFQKFFRVLNWVLIRWIKGSSMSALFCEMERRPSISELAWRQGNDCWHPAAPSLVRWCNFAKWRPSWQYIGFWQPKCSVIQAPRWFPKQDRN